MVAKMHQGAHPQRTHLGLWMLKAEHAPEKTRKTLLNVWDFEKSPRFLPHMTLFGRTSSRRACPAQATRRRRSGSSPPSRGHGWGIAPPARCAGRSPSWRWRPLESTKWPGPRGDDSDTWLRSPIPNRMVVDRGGWSSCFMLSPQRSCSHSCLTGPGAI